MRIKSLRQPIFGEFELGEDELDEEVNENIEPDPNYARTISKTGTLISARSAPQFYFKSHGGGGGGEPGEDCFEIAVNAEDWTFFHNASFDEDEDALQFPAVFGPDGDGSNNFGTRDFTLSDLGVPADTIITELKVTFNVMADNGEIPPAGLVFCSIEDATGSPSYLDFNTFVSVNDEYLSSSSDWRAPDEELNSDTFLKLFVGRTAGAGGSYFVQTIEICARWEI